jgi:hypothetical protein
MRLFPRLPDNMGFWRKWNFFCIVFTCGCLLAARFCKEEPEVVDSAEFLVWIGGAGLALGFFMQFWQNRKK